ncbi:MAG: two-component system response regulator CreB [Deltaproteobacteria bacterium]|nr:MAG: two-component system response regulator CreB [Deltaproteobacteria bacterium]
MKETILLIEDERAIADTVVYALEREGFQAVWSQTGADGLQQLEERQPVLLILDIGLPDGNGLDLCRTIRQSSQLPIIFLSARNEELDRILGLELGGDDYVTKPFSPRELVARVRSVLRRHRHIGENTPVNEPPGNATLGPFAHDTEEMRIYIGDTALELSLHEYRLLALLLGRPKKVFTRNEILDLAWEEPAMITDRTVDAHIKSIRKKIRQVDRSLDPIRTVRGVGYALELDLDSNG